jgi:hypothetical protein
MNSQSMDAGMESLIKAIAERQEAMEHELSALAAAVTRIERRLNAQLDAEFAAEIDAGPAGQTGSQDFSAHKATVEVLAAGAPGQTPVRRRGVNVEIKAVIAAAAAVAGEIAKTRKARLQPGAQDSGSAWSQQGRVGVVSSHNLR